MACCLSGSEPSAIDSTNSALAHTSGRRLAAPTRCFAGPVHKINVVAVSSFCTLLRDLPPAWRDCCTSLMFQGPSVTGHGDLAQGEHYAAMPLDEPSTVIATVAMPRTENSGQENSTQECLIGRSARVLLPATGGGVIDQILRRVF